MRLISNPPPNAPQAPKMSVTMYLKIHILSKRWTFSPEGGEGVGSARTLELKRGVIRWWTNIRLWPISRFRRTGIDRLTCVGNGPHHSTESGGISSLVSVRCQVSEIHRDLTTVRWEGGDVRCWDTSRLPVRGRLMVVRCPLCTSMSAPVRAVLCRTHPLQYWPPCPVYTRPSVSQEVPGARHAWQPPIHGGSPVNSHQRDHKQAHPKLSIHRMHGMHGRHTCLP